jgi:hypothetical protein
MPGESQDALGHNGEHVTAREFDREREDVRMLLARIEVKLDKLVQGISDHVKDDEREFANLGRAVDAVVADYDQRRLNKAKVDEDKRDIKKGVIERIFEIGIAAGIAFFAAYFGIKVGQP